MVMLGCGFNRSSQHTVQIVEPVRARVLQMVAVAVLERVQVKVQEMQVDGQVRQVVIPVEIEAMVDRDKSANKLVPQTE